MNYKKYNELNDDIIKIRTSVFIEEQGFKDEFDEIDKTCFHIVLYDGEIPVATCRYFEDNKSFHIGRVAIIKEYRGKHLGSKIMQIAEKEIKLLNANQIEVSAQVRVKDFYKKLGYKEVGEIYLDEFCEHIRMEKRFKI